MRLWRRPAILINAALAVLAVAGGLLAVQIVRGGASAAATDGTTRTRMVPATMGAVTQTVSATGSVASAVTAAANFATAGTVTELDVKVGDPVTKGQVLAKVDATAAQAALNTAKANRSAAYAAQTRAQDAGSDAATLASASAQVTSAEAAVTTAQQTVNGTVLTAPIAGTVTAVNGAVGSSSGSGSGSGSGSSGSTGNSGGNSSGTGGTGAANSTGTSSSSSPTSSGFIALADLTKMQINASFAEADATKLKVGQVTNVTWSALTGARATGKIATIAPTATTANNVNSYAVVISLDNLPDGVRIGQSTTAVVTIAEADNVLRIPTAALRTAGGQRTVEVSANGKTEFRTVEVGIQGNDFVEITSGLNEGDVVVITTTVSPSTGTNNGFPGGGGGFFGGNGGAGNGAVRRGGN